MLFQRQDFKSFAFVLIPVLLGTLERALYGIRWSTIEGWGEHLESVRWEAFLVTKVDVRNFNLFAGTNIDDAGSVPVFIHWENVKIHQKYSRCNQYLYVRTYWSTLTRDQHKVLLSSSFTRLHTSHFTYSYHSMYTCITLRTHITLYIYVPHFTYTYTTLYGNISQYTHIYSITLYVHTTPRIHIPHTTYTYHTLNTHITYYIPTAKFTYSITNIFKTVQQN